MIVLCIEEQPQEEMPFAVYLDCDGPSLEPIKRFAKEEDARAYCEARKRGRVIATYELN